MNTNKTIYASQALNSVIDAIADWAISDFSSNVNSCSTGFYYTAPNWDTFWTKYSLPTTYNYVIRQKDNFPITNVGIDKNGDTIVRVAATGFKKENFSIERDDMKLVISAKKEKSDRFKDVKWIERNIVCKDFEFVVDGSDKWNWDAIQENIEFENGILTIVIPLCEEAKPKKQIYQIK